MKSYFKDGIKKDSSLVVEVLSMGNIRPAVKDKISERLPICQTCPYFTADAGKPCAKERCAGCWEQTVKFGRCKDNRF